MPGERYAKVHSRFWIDPDIKALGRDARELYLYLISSPHSNMAGYYYLPISYVVEDMDTEGFPNGFETVRQGFQKLIQDRKIAYDPATKVVLLRNFLAWEPNPNPNQVKGILSVVTEVPKSLLLPEFVACAKRILPHYATHFETLLEGFRNPSETVSNPVTVTVTVTGTERDTSSVSVETGRVTPVPDGAVEVAAAKEVQQPAPGSTAKPEVRPARRQPQPDKADGPVKEKAWSPEAGRLASKLYDWLKDRKALPAMDPSKFYQEQAAKAERALKSGKTETELAACLDWAFKHRFWAGRIRDFGQVSIEIFTQYAREAGGFNGRGSEPAGGPVGTGPGAGNGAQYDRVSE